MRWRKAPVPAASLGEAGPVGITMDGTDLLVGRYEGRLWAIEDLCSHAACAFTEDGEVDGNAAICDCHGSEFDVFTGEVLEPPAQDPLRTFQVREVGGLSMGVV